jgi:predicted transcriptional regulator
MKSVIISIRPEWCEKILNGEKTIEVRKTAPKPPFKVYIYCTKGRDSLVYSKDPEDIAWCKPFIDKENNRVWTTHNSKLRKYCKDREWNGKVVAEFVCNNVEDFSEWEYDYPSLLRHIDLYAGTKGDYRFLDNYLKGNKKGYALHITDLNIYDKPKGLGEFYSIKQCKPEYSPFGYQWTWEDRHKRNPGGWENEYRPVPIECHRCKSLVGGKDYLDEKSGCILFDYECASKYHKPIARPPQSWQYIEEE